VIPVRTGQTWKCRRRSRKNYQVRVIGVQTRGHTRTALCVQITGSDGGRPKKRRTRIMEKTLNEDWILVRSS
jgi:hypothetical protein